MKLKTVHIKNFKNIEELRHDIDGQNIILLAENMGGKSSFMQAVQIALGGKNIPPNMVSDGQQKGHIQVVTDANGEEYRFECKLQPNQRPVITVFAPDGMKDNRKSVIGSICGEIDFDVDHFINLSKTTSGRREQVEIVKSFLSKDILDELKKHEEKIEKDFNKRTEVNREVSALLVSIKESGLTPEDRATYAKPIDVKQLNEKHTAAVALNTKIASVTERKDERKTELDELTKKLQHMHEQQTLATEFLSQNKVVDVEKMKVKLDEADTHNTQNELVVTLKENIEKHKTKEAESGDLTALIESSKQVVQDTVRDFEGPVPGLTFDEDSLYYNDHAVDINTLATSEIMHLGIKLQMAKNPGAKVLFIQRGESLGLERLKDIQAIAEKEGYQLIMEQVERGKEKLEIQIMPQY